MVEKLKALGADEVPDVETMSLEPLRPEDLAAPQKAPSAVAMSNTSAPISIKEVYGEMKEKLRESIIHSSASSIMTAMRVVNIVVACLMIIIAITEMVSEDSFWSGVNNIFSVFYTISFAMMLLAYEFRNASFDGFLREHFGFMYRPIGRCFFLVLISIFPLGMMGVYGILVSISGFLNAYFNFFVINKHPSFTRGVPDYAPPDVDSSSETSALAASTN